MTGVFLAKSIAGKFSLGSDINRERFQCDVKAHPNATYRIERIQPKRSLAQNAFFWLFLEVIERETGNTTADMHEYVKRYLTPKVERTVRILENGKMVKHVGMAGKGTSELTKMEMSDVMDKLSALTGVSIPDPQEAGFIRSR